MKPEVRISHAIATGKGTGTELTYSTRVGAGFQPGAGTEFVGGGPGRRAVWPRFAVLG